MRQYYSDGRNLRYLDDNVVSAVYSGAVVDILAMYDNSIPIKTIAKTVAHLTGDSVRAVLPVVRDVIYRHSVWYVPTSPVDCLDDFLPLSMPPEPPLVLPTHAETRTEISAEINRSTWAVGNLCTRRY